MNYDVITIKRRIIAEIKGRGLSVIPTLETIGISKNTLDNANKSMPKSDTLARIADYLGCSVDYLLGRPADGITAEERQLLELFRACSEADRDQLLDLASLYSAREAVAKAKRAE